MRFTTISDIHVHNFKKFDKKGSRLQNCLSVIQDTFEYNDKHGIECTLFPGDLYDSEKVLPTIVVNKTIELFQNMFNKYPKQRWIAISGNHDYASKNLLSVKAESALDHLQRIFPERFILIDNSVYTMENDNGHDVNVFGIPYYEYTEHFLDKLASANCEYEENGYGALRSKCILMIHQTPEHDNPNIPFDFNADDPLFDNFDLVLCGHIHKRQRLSDKFWLVGSPLHKSLDDEGLDKGFMDFDTQDLSKPDFIHLDQYPVFKRSKVIDPEDTDYVIPIVEFEEEETDFKSEDFTTNLKHEDLITNFWKEVDGEDQKLLQTGLSLLQ